MRVCNHYFTNDVIKHQADHLATHSFLFKIKKYGSFQVLFYFFPSVMLQFRRIFQFNVQRLKKNKIINHDISNFYVI